MKDNLFSTLFNHINSEQMDNFNSAYLLLKHEISQLQIKAVSALKQTIVRCFKKGKPIEGNIAGFDYVIEESARQIFKEKALSEQSTYKLKYKNATHAQEIRFNQFKRLKVENKFNDLLFNFMKKNSEIVEVIGEEKVQDLLPKYDEFFDNIIKQANDNTSLPSNQIVNFLQDYDRKFQQVNASASSEIGLAISEMKEKLCGEHDIQFIYDKNTGKLTGCEENVSGDLSSIEQAKKELDFFIACSEYFENQKVNIVMQMESNRNFADTLCNQSKETNLTRKLTASENAVGESVFGQYFDKIVPRATDSRETIKDKAKALDMLRESFIKCSAYLKTVLDLYVTDYRAKNGIKKEKSNNRVLTEILTDSEECGKLYKIIKTEQDNLSKIINLSIKNPLKSKNDVVEISKSVRDYIEENLDKMNPLWRIDFDTLVRDGYLIFVPPQLNNQEVKNRSYGNYVFSLVKELQSDMTHKKGGLKEENSDIRDIVDAVFKDTIGLEKIKDKIFGLACLFKSLPRNSSFRTLTFMLCGDPGSGKTTTAKKIHQVLRATQVLTNDKMYNDIAASIKAGYTGQTVPKIIKIFTEYKGGTIFLDEADSLFSGTEDSFSPEARSAFIKQAEENWRDTAIILACYKSKMRNLTLSNPGIFSRFAGRMFELPDYTPEQLVSMCQLKLDIDAEKSDSQPYVYTPEARKALAQFFEYLSSVEKEEDQKENARAVTRVVQGTLMEKAIRSQEDKNITKDDVNAFIEEDKKQNALENRPQMGFSF